jgi:predicted DNA-binding transcriptional regulator YafY
MTDDPLNRLSRLAAILIQLQSRKIVSAGTLAERFGVSTRTIYRDIRTLEQSGVPVVTEEGKGFSLIEGYRMPPVSFTEQEANALITAEQLVLRNTDASFVKDYSDAVTKIRAVLRYSTKDKAELLASRIAIGQNEQQERTSTYVSEIQAALTNFLVTDIAYQKEDEATPAWRSVEPYAMLSSERIWMMAAWCRTREAFRLFRLDRIKGLRVTTTHFEPHKLKLDEYLNSLRNR